MKKICNICFKEKELTEFYVNAGMKDGYQNRCIECTKQKTKDKLKLINSDPVRKQLERDRHREKYHRLGYKDKHKPTYDMKKVAMATYKKNFPEKFISKSLSQRIRPIKQGNSLHHWSYNINDAKDVIEMSKPDHYTAHRHIIYDQEHFKYRTLDNVLLETREQHIIYLKKIGVTVEDIQ